MSGMGNEHELAPIHLPLYEDEARHLLDGLSHLPVQLVAHCGGEYGEHPRVLGDSLLLGLGGDERPHVVGDAQGFDGAFLFDHDHDDSTHAVSTVIVSALSDKAGRKVLVAPPGPRNSDVGGH